MTITLSRYAVHQGGFLLTATPATGVSAVTISIPHDGFRTLREDFGERATGSHWRDVAVGDLVADIAVRAEVGISIVRGLLPRSVCDYNRPAPRSRRLYPESDTAFDDPRIGPFWQSYHQRIMTTLVQALRHDRQPLLLDFHGFRTQPAYGNFDVILGTGNRGTLTSDVDLALGQYLQALGYSVFIPADRPMVAGLPDHLSGRYTIRSVFESLGVDAVQVEIARRFRTPEGRLFGQQLAGAFAGFIDWYQQKCP